LLGLGLLKLLCLVATLELAQQTCEAFPQFLLLQENGHDNRFKWPWARYHNTRLDVQLGAINEPVKNGLILFRKCSRERCPSATCICHKLPEWWKGFAQSSDLPLAQS
jgi:hypothetical protein